jgi:hypothetical protein
MVCLSVWIILISSPISTSSSIIMIIVTYTLTDVGSDDNKTSRRPTKNGDLVMCSTHHR